MKTKTYIMVGCLVTSWLVGTIHAECCIDDMSWVDSDGEGCTPYTSNQYCVNGEVGPGWDSSWGTFEDYTNDGFSAMDKCCVCYTNNAPVCGDAAWTSESGRSCADNVLRGKCLNGNVFVEPRMNNDEDIDANGNSYSTNCF